MNKTSRQIKDEATATYYGINPESLRVEKVGLTRGGTLTYWPIGSSPSVYRIRGGRPALEEVARVFHLTDVLGIAFRADTDPAHADDPLLAALLATAATRRHARGDFHDYDAAIRAEENSVSHADHRSLSEYEHRASHPGAPEGIHPLAGPALAAAGWLRDAPGDDEAQR